MNVQERVLKLQKRMNQEGMDMYLVPTADFHQTEYVGAYFKARSYITGFTGSAGTAVITRDGAFLWVDGRYFIQAERQLTDSGITLMKIGEPGVPDMEDYMQTAFPEGGVLGFDGRVVSVGEGKAYETIVSKKNGSIRYECDLIHDIWSDRPSLSEKPAYALALEYAGEETASKLQRLREEMQRLGTTVHVISALDDINWLLNIRGDDIEFYPVVLCYAIVTMDAVKLYIDERKLPSEVKSKLADDGVHLYPYNDIYDAVKRFTPGDSVLLDTERTNYALYCNIDSSIHKVEAQNPSILFKAMKNPVELENIKKAHIKDSVAHVKFIYWLKNHIGKERITEISASNKLDEFRAAQDNYLGPSFAPISCFGEHAAMVHYSASPETDAELSVGSVYLFDTGGAYKEGSTDITRTVTLGSVPQIMKDHFTATVLSNLHLAHAKFLYGCTGMNLDILARAPFWNQNLNYKHGTGHGVGYLLSIHEPASGFRWQHRSYEAHCLEDGMVLTDEPGIYIEGSHGIRIENELLVRKGIENEYGTFMHFEVLTFIPIDLDAINPALMSEEEKKWLNDYHQEVYEKISPCLNEEEKIFLEESTRKI